MAKTNRNVRLSPDIKPLHYALTLKPDLESSLFEGEEIIHLFLAKPTKTITLHSKDLDIESVQVIVDKEGIFALKIKYDEKAETASFIFAKGIPKGEIRLKIIFRGVLNEKMRGFYRSSYVLDGKTRHIATTQFEAVDARRAFPCFDEPAIKATFDVSLIVPKASVAISNTVPTEITEYGSGHKVVKFARTPKMSTYLLAFIAGDFEHVEKRTKEGVLVRVFVTPGKKHQAKFALDCAVRSLSFYNKYFNIPYPLPVLDMIAIPDFAAGAMENWGAVTYRESALLLDPEHSSTSTKQRVAIVIAHELAHQWFGNLVTMEWWTHLWLNEGFASYIEYLAVDSLFPKWDMWTQFVYGDLGVALDLDALKNTHPIEVNVHHPDEINEIFDTVSYSKGASIIRMLAGYLGERDFRDGLRHYLKKHSYGNTSTVHLWEAFEKVSGKPVTRMMSGWTGRPGYPLLTVSESKNGLSIKQERFFSNPISKKLNGSERPWSIPLSVGKGAKAKVTKLLMEGRSISLPSALAVGNNSWFKVNVGESGFFRTSYPKRLQDALKDPIKNKQLGATDRLGLVRDIMAATEAGDVVTTDALEFAEHYKNETDYTVWAELASDLGRIKRLIAHEIFAEKYDRFALSVFAKIAKKVGWESRPGEGHTEILLRTMILMQYGAYGDPATIARARRMFSRIKPHDNPVHPDLRSVVYNIVAKYGKGKEYAKLTAMYKAATLHEEKNRIAGALGAFKDKAPLKKTLALSMSKDVRSQDTIGVIAGVWRNPLGADLAWEFVKKDWKKFLDRYGSGHDLSRLVGLAELFSSPKRAGEIRDFFKKNPAPSATRTVEQALEKIYSNAAWLARDKKKLATWLLDQ